MTGRAVFGDFLAAAHRHLDPANREHGPSGARGGLDQAAPSLARAAAVMGRCLQDMSAAFEDAETGRRAGPDPWGEAFAQGRRALANVAGPVRAGRAPSGPRAVPVGSLLARRLDGVTVSLTAGRDLLHTHFAPALDGERKDRSEWAEVIASPPITQAVLAEFAVLGRKMAAHGTELAQRGAPDAGTTAESRRRLEVACRWLLTFDTAVRAARQREPVPAGDRELLWAIPANAFAPRRLPSPSDPVPVLWAGVIASAERARHAAWAATTQDSWFPGVTVTSLRQVAEAGIGTSHHCDIILRTLAAQSSRPGFPAIGEDLLAAADEVGRARRTWLEAARSLEGVTTDMQERVSPAASEASDLAWWTGRLAYADPAWTPGHGPAHAARAPGELAPEPEDVRAVVAAVHHASHSLARLAQADQAAIHVGERAGRILAPSRSLPEGAGTARPFGRAPRDRVEPVLAAYREAGEASTDATAVIGGVAEEVRASSRVITAAIATGRQARAADRGAAAGAEKEVDAARGDGERGDPAGPVERTLLGLGVTRAEVLQRGAELDRASVKVILDAAEGERGRGRAGPMLGRSAGTSGLVNYVLAAGDLRAQALLRRPVTAQRESPEPEP